MDDEGAILIAGPTASGKSRLALTLARQHGGTIVNADSMQVYDGLRILSARPSQAEMEGLPHRLYGFADPAQAFSTGDWIRALEPVLGEIRAAGRRPVIVGGTGLYFRALTRGLDDMPPVPPELRQALRARHEAEGTPALHARLAQLDPAAAGRIRPSDSQRVLRALELIEATGLPLAQLQAGRGRPLLSGPMARIVLTPERGLLRERIAARFHQMMAEGAEEEAAAFARRPGALDHSAALAIGLRELIAWQAGEISRDVAVQRAITRTHQYAKRQETWFRNQFGPEWTRISQP